jgi:hypothetical protein
LTRKDSQQMFTLGAMVSYLFVSGPNPEAFNLDGAIKYWY